MNWIRGTIAVAVLATAVAVTSAQSSPGQPLQQLWNAISQLASRVTALETMPPGGGPLRVVNGVGASIGFYEPSDRLLHFDGAMWFSVGPLGLQGFGDGPGRPIFYELPNCGGNVYISERAAAPLVRTVTVMEGIAYFAGDPIVAMVAQSQRVSPSSGCGAASPSTRFLGPATAFDLSVFGPAPYSVQ